MKTLFSFCDHKFDKQTICKIGINIICALEYMHNKGFLFLDLMPHNIAIILVGIQNKENSNTLLGLIDLGSLISYIDNYGNYRKKKDYLESLVYLLLYFYKFEMPWDSFDRENKEEYKIHVLKEKKNEN